jgi:hypothetical protein
MKTLILAFALGCNLQPAWLCDLNSTWWTHGTTEAAQRAWLLSHCSATPSTIACRDNGATVRVPRNRS